MKLYTEEQLDLAFLKGHSLGGLGVNFTLEIVEDMRKELTPIELPSKKEIRKESHNYFIRGQLGFESAGDTERAFLKGVLWTLYKIQGGNK